MVVLDNVTSGGATFNDSFIHCQTPQAPLGGVGESGTGHYHGYYSFKAFSHLRTIAQTPSWAEKFLRVRYMPYSIKELKFFQAVGEAKPDFDRNGRQIKGVKYLLGLVFSLGSKSAKGALFKWAVLALAAAYFGLKQGFLGFSN